MADDPILDANGTYGEVDEFAELAAIGGVDGDSFGQDLLGIIIFLILEDFLCLFNYAIIISRRWERSVTTS